MNTYNLSYTLDPEQYKMLADLARRCKSINGWGIQELLQHAAACNHKAEMALKLDFLQKAVTRLENEHQAQAAKEHPYITEEEHARCQRVVNTFAEIYSVDLMVLDTGEYGFVKLQYCHPPFGYDGANIFTSSRDLFDDLWNEWISLKLLDLTKGTPLAELDYLDMLRCLPENQQTELLNRRKLFLTQSGISLRESQ